MSAFATIMAKHEVDLTATEITVMQTNITRLCNQACAHCHVGSSPQRREMMGRATVDRCLEILEQHPQISTLDVTGGAPELNPEFRYFVRNARALGKHVIVRHNLTVTFDAHPLTGESLAYLPTFFAEQGVEVISSLPHYQPYLTDRQRGDGVFDRSIEGIRLLNRVGYGVEGSGLLLNLAHNPVLPHLPGLQCAIEGDYHRELLEHHGVTFNGLFAITNAPISRFANQLDALGETESYRELLTAACNPDAAARAMCRSMVSVGYDGTLYDCDFNQMLDLPIGIEPRVTVFDFDAVNLANRAIRIGDQCFACAAGAGSSCAGATT
jgi:radical SAM/Cys-rich protein